MPQFYVINDYGELELWEFDEFDPTDKDPVRSGKARPYLKVIGADVLSDNGPCRPKTREYLKRDPRFSWKPGREE